MAPLSDKLSSYSQWISPGIRIVQLILACVMIVFSSIHMWNYDLWGYSSLYFFIGWWLLFQVIFGFWKGTKSSWKYWLLSSVSGILFFLGFPDPSITPAIFLAFLPLLWIIEKTVEEKRNLWFAIKYCFSSFLLWNILSTFWVANTSFLPSIFAFTLNAVFMCIPMLAYILFRRKFSLSLSLVAWSAFWISFEMIHLRWEISWPWLTLGNAFSSRSLWIQWYEITGHLGGSLWVLLVNSLFFVLIRKIGLKKTMHPVSLLYPMLAVMVPIFISYFIFFRYEEKGEWINVLIVQPNFEPHFEKFEIPVQHQVDRYEFLIHENVTDSTDYVLCPETILGSYDLENIENQASIQRILAVFDSFPNTIWVTGMSTHKWFDKKEKGIHNLREVNRGGNTRFIQFQNTALSFHANELKEEHIKGKLVPGAEIFPYSNLLFFLEPIVKLAGGTTAGLARDKHPTTFRNGKVAVAPAICYESVYGYWMRKYIMEGAEAIFVLTNDGWWDNTPGHRQHLAYSILRAIELRKSIARSANTGISCYIDQHGRVYEPLAYGEEGVIHAKIQANDKRTLYARYGDIVGRISYLLSLIFLAFLFRLQFRKNKSKSNEG